MKPWNIRPGMLIRVGTRPYGSGGATSDYREVVDVSKQRRYFGPGSAWLISFREFGRTESVLRFADDNCDVRKAA